MYVQDTHITGDIDYFNDNCSGKVKGTLLSDTKLSLSETIIKGSDICENGTYLYGLKHHLISKAINYHLAPNTHSVAINKYDFIANQDTWNNVILKDNISQQEKKISEQQSKINDIQTLILQAKQEKQKAQEYLDHNLSNYTNHQCTTPALAKKPFPFFDTEEKAKEYALAYCSVSFGCRVGVELARDKLDTFSKRFLASQSCTLLVRDYIGNNTLREETMFNLLDAVSYAGCDDDSEGLLSAVFQGGSCVMNAVTRLARAGQYINCIGYKTEQFHNTYLDWRDAPQNLKTDCEAHLKIINDTPTIISKYHKTINGLTDKKIQLETQLKVYKNELKKINLLREKQLKLLNSLKK